jgi:hypothetical protein
MSDGSRIRFRFRIPATSPGSAIAMLISIVAGLIVCGAGSPLGNWIVATTQAQTPSGLSARYPGDVGIEQDPAVVFVEKFEAPTVLDVLSRWTDVLNGAAMTFSSDVAAGSTAGSRSLNISSVGGGVSNGGHLYRQLAPAITDTLYVRYYIKYPTNSSYSHQGIWMGGHNPAVSWPDPQAGVRPVGNDRFSASAEQMSDTTTFDHYNYWMNMRAATDGKYWGNRLLNKPAVTGGEGQWLCVEQMVKLNNPVTAFNGEHAIWLNGVKVSHLGPGFPNGTWLGGNFTQNPAGTPFEGFRWRSDAALNLNWIWLQNYSPNDPLGVTANMRFDHVVAARSYIGCLASGSATPPPPAPPTNVRIIGTTSITPVAQVTVAPTTATLAAGATTQFTATVKDAGGSVLTGRSITWTTSKPTVATVNASGLMTAVAAGSATITATSESRIGTAAVTVTTATPPSTTWPNEPAGFVQLNDQPWNQLTGNAWNYLRRAASKDANIVSDSTAPFSPLNVLRMIFTTDMGSDREPGVHWMALSGVKEIYTAWWLKVSPNWQCSPAGCGKMSFLFDSGGGNVYSTILNPASGQGPPFRVGLKPQWGFGYDLNFYPNVTTTLIYPGEWRRLEFYYKYESSPGAGDGIFRWWVDGVLNGNYTDVRYPSAGFVEFQYAPTLQNAPSAEQYMYLDHTRVSRR